MNNQSVTERRQQTNKLIRELLEERGEVWMRYGRLGAMQPYGPNQTLENLVKQFCQILIDYISLGHFGVYQRIIDGTERRRKVIVLAEKFYPRIAEATDAAVTFNDKYERLAGDELRRNLAHDLSVLGEELAKRFELEDSLIETMMA
ncbi:MAG TPA: Rsd/AlgQ family anti-sigma factor [Methylococcaceae bacterium]|jgi:regulator of sigma D|nr:Rsd/AlgQ family anti-sigma factor [Methylococcaceae bacterium]